MIVFAPSFEAKSPGNTGRVKVLAPESTVPSQPADTLEDGQSRNPRSRLEKLNGKGQGPGHRSTEVPTANRGHRSSRSTEALSSNQGAQLFRRTAALTIEYSAGHPTRKLHILRFGVLVQRTEPAMKSSYAQRPVVTNGHRACQPLSSAILSFTPIAREPSLVLWMSAWLELGSARLTAPATHLKLAFMEPAREAAPMGETLSDEASSSAMCDATAP